MPLMLPHSMSHTCLTLVPHPCHTCATPVPQEYEEEEESEYETDSEDEGPGRRLLKPMFIPKTDREVRTGAAGDASWEACMQAMHKQNTHAVALGVPCRHVPAACMAQRCSKAGPVRADVPAAVVTLRHHPSAIKQLTLRHQCNSYAAAACPLLPQTIAEAEALEKEEEEARLAVQQRAEERRLETQQIVKQIADQEAAIEAAAKARPQVRAQPCAQHAEAGAVVQHCTA